jgi:Transposase, Mutator family
LLARRRCASSPAAACGVKLLVSDAHGGIKAVVSGALNATWQRCCMHFMRNALPQPAGQADQPQGPGQQRATTPRSIQMPFSLTHLLVASNAARRRAMHPALLYSERCHRGRHPQLSIGAVMTTCLSSRCRAPSLGFVIFARRYRKRIVPSQLKKFDTPYPHNRRNPTACGRAPPSVASACSCRRQGAPRAMPP